MTSHCLSNVVQQFISCLTFGENAFAQGTSRKAAGRFIFDKKNDLIHLLYSTHFLQPHHAGFVGRTLTFADSLKLPAYYLQFRSTGCDSRFFKPISRLLCIGTD